MVLMAGMLPGVECARRRRVRHGAAEEPPCGTRRPSLCLYAGGHDHAHLGSKEIRSSSCKETARAWTLDNTAREAKERLDQKLRSQRESVVVKRRQSSCTARTLTSKAQTASSDGTNNSPSATTAAEEAQTMTCVLRREVLATKNTAASAGRRRFIWSRLARRPPAPAAEECAVCLEELRAGDVLVHLPCAHRFHWPCAVPWVKAASRCPVCRAQVHLLAAEQEQLAAAGRL